MKLGLAVQIEQPSAAARWVSSLGMQQLMAAWVLGGKMGFSRVGMGSSDMAWAVVSSRRGWWRHDSLSLSSLTFSVSPLPFFFPFVFGFSVWFWSLPLTAGFLFYFYFNLFFIYIFLRFSWALASWVAQLEIGRAHV